MPFTIIGSTIHFHTVSPLGYRQLMARQQDKTGNRESAIRVGAIFMLTGPIAELGQDSLAGAEVALRLGNDQGGVNGRRLEWVVADGYSTEEAARQAERLITEEGVRVIVGCYGSNHSIAVSKVCEKHKAVLWVQTAWTADLFNHRPRYTIRTNTYATPVEDAAVGFALNTALPRIGKRPERARVAVISEASAYGVSCAQETVRALKARELSPNLEHTYNSQYDGTSLDYGAVVEKVRGANPDVLFVSSFIRDSIGLLNAMRAVTYRPPIIMASSAGFGFYTLSACGDMAEGILTANAPALVNTAALNSDGRELQREYVSRLKGLTGREPSGFNAMAFCAAYSLFHDVMPRAAAVDDAEAIRHAALSLFPYHWVAIRTGGG